MNNYLNSSKVMQMSAQLINYIKTSKECKVEAEALIKETDGKVRLIQTFFDSPTDCLSGKFKLQALNEKDVQQMYPDYIELARSVQAPKFVYVFVCNDGIESGTALISNTIIE
jgi:hypothetical protein